MIMGRKMVSIFSIVLMSAAFLTACGKMNLPTLLVMDPATTNTLTISLPASMGGGKVVSHLVGNVDTTVVVDTAKLLSTQGVPAMVTVNSFAAAGTSIMLGSTRSDTLCTYIPTGSTAGGIAYLRPLIYKDASFKLTIPTETKSVSKIVQALMPPIPLTLNIDAKVTMDLTGLINLMFTGAGLNIHQKLNLTIPAGFPLLGGSAVVLDTTLKSTKTKVTDPKLDQCASTPKCGNGTVDAGETCDSAIPAGKPGACPISCDDGNACTGDVMTGSPTTCNVVCTHTSVVCSAPDQCHVAGMCNTTTGVCSNPNKTNGTVCNDGNACTQTDTCQSGICTGSNPVVCSALDQCHDVGVCNSTTGVCSNPNKTDGTVCIDDNACTQTDSCFAGVCVGSTPVVCPLPDQCHLAGVCDPYSGVCSNPSKPDGNACNDANACTQTDICQAGICTGSNPVVCSSLDQCHVVGVCNTTTGVCSNPNKTDGTGCNDGDLCTQTDTCRVGVCTGSNPVVCSALDQCHAAGACDPSSGSCSNPTLADGTACNDGNACTQTDACQSGICTGSNPVVCLASDQCPIAGVCDPSTGTCSNPTLADGTACTPTKPVKFSMGSNTVELSQFVSPDGGTLTITDPASPIHGVVVSFPGGALPQGAQVTIGHNDGSLTPNSGTYSGVNILINVEGVMEFSQPVTITVPFNDPNGVPVPYYITESGTLRPAQLVSVDRANGTFAFQTFHASLYTWIAGLIAPGANNKPVDAGFVPNEDGFQVTNNGSAYNRGGECFGMTSFALWYYLNYKSSSGDFYPRFYSVLGQNSFGESLRGQDIIATRAFISISQKWNVYLPTVVREENLTQQERYATIRNVIDNTQEPVLIYLYHASGASGAHSVLAYGYNETDGSVSIYDPNHPGAVNIIQYDQTSNSFNAYSGYDGIVYNGDGSLNLTEPYQNILDDAETDFHSSTMPIIDVASYPSGSIVTTRNIVLNGTIQSAEVLVTKLIVHVGSVRYTADVSVDGSFSIPVSLESGINHLTFSLQGNSANGSLIDVSPTNMDTLDFIIELTVSNSVILWTLTWDKDDTDLDTYVIDPTGDYSCYYHMTTADGGVLDYDDTDGFGPEHWTLMNTNTVRYGQPYRFRLHYYSDHGNGGTNYTITIKLYEGTSRETIYTYSGYLSANAPSNNAPLDTGPDWADIAELTLTQGTSAAPALTLAPMSAVSPSTLGTGTITTPVPSLEERLLLKARPER